MKSIGRITITMMIAFSITASMENANGQDARGGHRQLNSKVVVVKKRNHIFKKKVAYHPHWAPKANFYRRWVYFPHYNFYWDNLHNVYVFRTDKVWVISKNAPKEVEKVDLSAAKKVELNEENDNQNSIQENNEEHRAVYGKS